MHTELKKVVAQALNQRFEIESKIIQQVWSNENFKQELIKNPKTVLAKEFGQEIPEEIEVEVLQETNNKVYLVLPSNPIPALDQEELSEETLETIAGGGCIASFGSCIGFTFASNANDLV